MEQTAIEPMPQMLALNFVMRSITPVRMRRIASAALYIVGTLCLLGGLLIVADSAAASGERQWFNAQTNTLDPSDSPDSPPFPVYDTTDAFNTFMQSPSTYIGLGILGLGLACLCCAIGVRRGSLRAAAVGTWIFLPALLFSAVAVAVSATVVMDIILKFYGIYELPAAYLIILLLVFGLLFLALILLAADVHAVLCWLANNPLGETENRRLGRRTDQRVSVHYVASGGEAHVEKQTIEPLPQMLVLNYVSRPTTKNRTRRIPATVLQVLGGVMLALGILNTGAAAFVAYTEVTMPWYFYTPYGPAGPPAPSGMTAIYLATRNVVEHPQFYVGIGLVSLGITYLICAVGVLRSHFRRTIVAIWTFAPIPACLLIMTTCCFAFAVVSPYWLEPPPDHLRPWLIVLAFVSLLLTLLAWDVHVLLRWAGRNPMEEMEKRKFLPGKW